VLVVGVVVGDPRVAFGGRHRQILSYVHGWASPIVVRGAVCCHARVLFLVGTEREVSGRGEMKPKTDGGARCRSLPCMGAVRCRD
jgi:hypothetical protein